jgi:hypothetical protein
MLFCPWQCISFLARNDYCQFIPVVQAVEEGFAKGTQSLIAGGLIVEQSLNEIPASVSEASNKGCANSSADSEVAGEAITLEEANESAEESEGSITPACNGVIQEVYRMFFIAEVNPLSSELYIFCFGAIEHFDRGIVSGDDFRLQKDLVHVLIQDQKNGSDMGVEVRKSRAVKVNTTTSIDVALSIKRDVVKISRDGNLSEQSGCCQTIFHGLCYFCNKFFRQIACQAFVNGAVEIFEV